VLDGVLRVTLGDLRLSWATSKVRLRRHASAAWGTARTSLLFRGRLLVVVREPEMLRFRYPRGGYGKV
jgi:hypothetical protein